MLPGFECNINKITLHVLFYFTYYVCEGYSFWYLAVVPYFSFLCNMLLQFTSIYLPVLLMNIWIFSCIFAIINKAAMKVLRHVFWWIYSLIFLGYIPRNKVTLLNFSRYYQTIYQSVCTYYITVTLKFINPIMCCFQTANSI